MSMPAFPAVSNSLTRDAAVNQLLSAIAMEGLSLSHILNANGEKIQYVLGTLTGQTVSTTATLQDLLDIDADVRATLASARETQLLLIQQMQVALAAVADADA